MIKNEWTEALAERDRAIKYIKDDAVVRDALIKHLEEQIAALKEEVQALKLEMNKMVRY